MMVEYLANLLLCHRGKWSVIYPQRDDSTSPQIHEGEWRQLACICLLSSSNPYPLVWSTTLAAVRQLRQEEKENHFSSFLSATLHSWLDLPGSSGNICSKTHHLKGSLVLHLELTILSDSKSQRIDEGKSGDICLSPQGSHLPLSPPNLKRLLLMRTIDKHSGAVCVKHTHVSKAQIPHDAFVS